MTADPLDLQTVRSELQTGMALPKCRQCGCMRHALDGLLAVLPPIGADAGGTLAAQVEGWSAQMESVRYACLGCEVCYAGRAENAFAQAFPSAELPALSCDFHLSEENWPVVLGEYRVLDRKAPIAVSTLGSAALAEEIAALHPAGLAIAGKTETENIGIDKVVKNIVANPSIRTLILAGPDPAGHRSGQTLLALAQNGVDGSGRVIGSPGKRPVLRNVSTEEIAAFREQIQVVDLIGCDSAEEVAGRILELAGQPVETCSSCSCSSGACSDLSPMTVSAPAVLRAAAPVDEVRLDRAGYFVILPVPERGTICVEHYAYDNTLLRVVEGREARSLYHTLLAGGWVTELSHAAYLGKELARAELSMRYGFPYVQDGA